MKFSFSSIILYLLIVFGLNFYLLNKYRVGDLNAKTISFSSNFNRYDILIYPTKSDGSGVDFSNPIHPIPVNGEFIFELGNSKIRNWRIDLGKNEQEGYIKNLTVHYGNYIEVFNLVDLKLEKIQLRDNRGNFSNKINGYLELHYNRISAFELILAEVLIFVLGLILSIIFFNIYRKYLIHYIKKQYLGYLFAGIFIFSIFFPQPLFNVFFMISFAIIVKDFSSKLFLKNVLGLLLLSYFVWFMVNNLFVTKIFNPKIVETLLPVFFLPFYIACLPKGNLLRFFPLSALVLSLYFIVTSIVDFSIFHNINYFSFDSFTKYLHPVYFSYLILFSLTYIELEKKESFNKFLFIPVLSFALLCCGSKLIISLTVMFYVFILFRKKIYLGYAFIAIVFCAVLLFAPTRRRFQEIFNANSLSILKENPISSIHDSRLTGLTLRLIIWQESFKTFTDLKNIIIGQGVDNAADQLLENKLILRNVELGHTKYDPHNQFITTFYKMGLLGLLILIGICLYCLKIAIEKKKILLLCTVLLFIIAMFTESVLQRVAGIFFFITLLLLQCIEIINSSHQIENSDPGNEGNSQ